MLTQAWRGVDERIEPARIRFVCAIVVGLSTLLLAISFVTAEDRITQFGPPLGADFAGFYNAGAILNQPVPADRDRLYDVAYQDELYHQLVPGLAKEKQLPFVHPPFVAVFFSYLARLPYELAFACWLTLSATMYVGGLFLLRAVVFRSAKWDWPTIFLLALSFEPFIMECWIGGQLSTFGFLCVATALSFEFTKHPFAAGMALGCLLYKPTLLVLIGPFLMVSLRWRQLLGFALAGLLLAAISLFGARIHNCQEYLHVLLGFTRTTTGAGATSLGELELPLWKYVDLNSFYRLLLDTLPPVHWTLVGITAAVPMGMLILIWWKSRTSGPELQYLAWAATLASTLVINLYVGIYDTILLVPALLLTVTFLSHRAGTTRLSVGWRALLLCVYVVPWFTQPIARHTGLQLYSLVLLVTALTILVQGRKLHAAQSAISSVENPAAERAPSGL